MKMNLKPFNPKDFQHYHLIKNGKRTYVRCEYDFKIPSLKWKGQKININKDYPEGFNPWECGK